MKDKKKIYIAVIILIIILLACLVYFVFFNNKKTNRVNVSVDSNGGSPVDNIIISDNNELTLPAIPTKEGYTFAGYEFDGDKIASNGMTVSKDVVLKAMWIDNNAEFVTVTFGRSQGESTKIKFVKGSSLKLLELPLRDGYVFGGWMNDNEELLNSSYILNDDLYLMPRWINKDAKTINVTVQVDDKTYSYVTIDGDMAILPVAPTKDGYTFGGWTLKDGTKVTKETRFNGDTTIVAVWNKACGCQDGYALNEDGKTCSKVVETEVSQKNTCPSGYSLKNGKCLKYSAKYAAENVSGKWVCNNGSHYMYTEEEAGGAMMWCVPTISVQKSNTCPSGYSLKDNKCIKTESVNCTTN